VGTAALGCPARAKPAGFSRPIAVAKFPLLATEARSGAPACKATFGSESSCARPAVVDHLVHGGSYGIRAADEAELQVVHTEDGGNCGHF